MLNYLWAGMMIIGILWGAFHGQLSAVTEGALQSSKEAVTLCITMLGVMSLWTGILEIGHRSGLVDQLSKRMSPFLTFLFPRLDKESEARKQIAVNMIANILGLGWAATPAGIKAMQELKTVNKGPHDKASKEMCTFMIINISSLQLIPMNMIAYRSQYGSVNPTAIVGPALVATLISTVVGVVFCKIMDRGGT